MNVRSQLVNDTDLTGYPGTRNLEIDTINVKQIC